jgi:hypothetical protein
LPRRTPPDGNLLDRFTILDDECEISAEEFIDMECKRLLTHPVKSEAKEVENKDKTTFPALPISSRPRSQMGLEAFVNDESPVDDDTKAQADAAAAAMSEIDAIDPEKKRLQD